LHEPTTARRLNVRRPTILAATLVAGVLVPLSAAPSFAGSDAVTVVNVAFDVGVVGQPMPVSIPNGGDPDVIATKVVKNGGGIVVANGRPANGRAADLPAYNGASTGPRAAVKVIDQDLSDGDTLSPGLQRFTFGADFTLDPVSVGSTYDNGNNLIQRGLAGTSDQYKIQVDKTAGAFRPSCRIAQMTGSTTVSALVTSTIAIESNRWYRVACTRDGSVLTIAVTPYNADGTAGSTVTTPKYGVPAIDLTWPTTGTIVPMSIGAKLNKTGAIDTWADQFNGLIDNATLTVG
jgi:hypothetical protein